MACAAGATHVKNNDFLQEHYNIQIEETPGNAKRLNVFVPHIFREYEFGGLSSVLEMTRYLSAFYEQVRFVSLMSTPGPNDAVDVKTYTRGSAKNTVSIASLTNNEPLFCHEHDVFLCTYWPSVFAWDILSANLRKKGKEANPFYYFIQDWEPGFYPMGYKHMLAESTYTDRDKCFPIFNSIELARFFKIKNYKFKSQCVIKPSLNNAFYNLLKTSHWALPPKPDDITTILVYGRPNQPRNCFDYILESIEKFFKSQPTDAKINLNFLSVGLPHEHISFSNGATLKSLGKLSIHDYSLLLLNSHVGVSLMASPHPSYPPLEMATFGLQVVTNNYLGKNLNGTHPNIHSLTTLSTSLLAEELYNAIGRAQNQEKKIYKAIIPASMSDNSWLRNFETSKIPIL